MFSKLGEEKEKGQRNEGKKMGKIEWKKQNANNKKR